MSKEDVLPIHNRVFDSLKEAILLVRKNGEIIKGNNAAQSLLKMEEYTSIFDYLDFSLLTENEESHLLMEQKNNNGKLIEIKSIRVEDNVYCLIMSGLPIHDKTDEVKKYINHLIHASAEGMVMYDNEVIIDCDQKFADMFGYSESEIKNMKISQLMDANSTYKLAEIIHNAPDKPYELTGVRKDGTWFHMEFMEHPYNNLGNIIRVAIIKDITDKVENEKRIEFMAYYDELTDLPNRNFFYKVLGEAIKEAHLNDEMLAVYFIDVNYFKEINDTLGYSFGDQLLKACSNRFKAFLHTDTFIARMAGDEFLILQRRTTNKESAIDLAKSLISEFEKPIKIDDYEMFLSISIGISIYPENGQTPNDLIKHADSAMYVIKEQHHNNYNVFESSISENFKAMLTMESELREALKEGHFELHYQPQKNLNTGKIIGMEALLRWNHPVKAYIPPDDFISLAEKTGLIIDIGDWVLKEACKQNKLWQDNGYSPVIVSVNLSAKQFHQKGLVEKIKNILDDTGLDPSYLELEITESMAMTNEEYILETIQQLRTLGVLVSIDDFGTGYSSLKYLSLFPITKLKIDKMFMNENQKQNQAIVKSIIHMSHSLDMKVIAEGVETIDQLNFLEGEKCDEMQGFYFSKPLPPDKLTKLFKIVG
ncbi:PAS domain S-box-containing protein/diguanylate cyclase (GGDEF) domain-containing protein [Virgibacillus subterraneus]|uniref:PAS domain S-box-containing protein/diguanylate cyclase (GGDEF) domain-containing protein n=2 Tax=Virgibacillus TaxID=84406 RepID=A0A1H1CMQ4_9BACI|nr:MULTISPECIES: bifunctional diguanylate cyclase/phosphodiesterase [Virgibacillus]SDQ65473.1 PAS domain S-box-containing protein/diguanylate cyclase (GGDEF) domain-containing protein [Virgibacillus salinus]SEQ63816.1 PAS domain S-box-containing protein/diguanylate cyclase (GGDEF) domain-containing protein [Virgibacillus subterraneus]